MNNLFKNLNFNYKINLLKIEAITKKKQKDFVVLKFIDLLHRLALQHLNPVPATCKLK